MSSWKVTGSITGLNEKQTQKGADYAQVTLDDGTKFNAFGKVYGQLMSAVNGGADTIEASLTKDGKWTNCTFVKAAGDNTGGTGTGTGSGGGRRTTGNAGNKADYTKLNAWQATMAAITSKQIKVTTIEEAITLARTFEETWTATTTPTSDPAATTTGGTAAAEASGFEAEELEIGSQIKGLDVTTNAWTEYKQANFYDQYGEDRISAEIAITEFLKEVRDGNYVVLRKPSGKIDFKEATPA